MIRRIVALFYLYCSCAMISPLFAVDSEEGIRFAFLGDGGDTQQTSEPDWEMLGQLFKQIKTENPRAVFFTGNLISGLEQSTTIESLRKLEAVLTKFSDLVKTHFEDKIPVYPIMGNHTFVNSQAVAIFRKHFGIENAAPLEPYQLAYDVYIDGIQFVLLATGVYERKYQGYRYYASTMPIFDWLAKTLRTDSRRIRYRFVVGHEPAFSAGFAEGKFLGIDKNLETRNTFWKILRQNKARAYFCSHEPIYDRSNRSGVWQVISGGVTVFNEAREEFTRVFPHHILLTVPKKGDANPSIKVIDLGEKVWDEFELLPVDRPVHQFRIS